MRPRREKKPRAQDASFTYDDDELTECPTCGIIVSLSSLPQHQEETCAGFDVVSRKKKRARMTKPRAAAPEDIIEINTSISDPQTSASNATLLSHDIGGVAASLITTDESYVSRKALVEMFEELTEMPPHDGQKPLESPTLTTSLPAVDAPGVESSMPDNVKIARPSVSIPVHVLLGSVVPSGTDATHEPNGLARCDGETRGTPSSSSSHMPEMNKIQSLTLRLEKQHHGVLGGVPAAASWGDESTATIGSDAPQSHTDPGAPSTAGRPPSTFIAPDVRLPPHVNESGVHIGEVEAASRAVPPPSQAVEKATAVMVVAPAAPPVRKVSPPWSEEEDRQLVALQSQIGNKWAQMARHFPGRSFINIRNHWGTLKKRAEAAAGSGRGSKKTAKSDDSKRGCSVHGDADDGVEDGLSHRDKVDRNTGENEVKPTVARGAEGASKRSMGVDEGRGDDADSDDDLHDQEEDCHAQLQVERKKAERQRWEHLVASSYVTGRAWLRQRGDAHEATIATTSSDDAPRGALALAFVRRADLGKFYTMVPAAAAAAGAGECEKRMDVDSDGHVGRGDDDEEEDEGGDRNGGALGARADVDASTDAAAKEHAEDAVREKGGANVALALTRFYLELKARVRCGPEAAVAAAFKNVALTVSTGNSMAETTNLDENS